MLLRSLLVLGLLAGGAPAPGQAAPKAAAAQKIDLTGTWEGTDSKGITASMTFRKDGRTVFTMGGESMGGDDRPDLRIDFRLDTGKSPHWLDLIMIKNPSQELGRMCFILEVLSPTRIRLGSADDLSQRPADFKGLKPDNQIILTKVR